MALLAMERSLDVPLGQWFSTGGYLVPHKTSGNIWRQSWFSQLWGGREVDASGI